jgi:superfamily II DNA or RNA helicase
MTTQIDLYSYQEDAISFVLDNIKQHNVLLAAAPNAGKTIMSSCIIKELIQDNKRILCSVHGTNVLKKQFYLSICNIVGIENVSVYDTSDFSLYDISKPIQVMIYQNTKQMEECVGSYGLFDYLVVDEAHKFYDNTESMNIIVDNFVSGNHLLLTGSPAIFKDKVNDGELVAKYISASLIESVQSGQYDKEILLDIVSNDVHLSLEDFNATGEVCKNAERKLTNNTLVLESVLVGDFGKTIIFVKRQQQANEIKTYLKSKHITTYISHSENDKGSDNIKKFREKYTGVDNVVLIVVNRATEGFDDPNVSIIDLTYTKNIDTLYQRYSRAIRRRTDAVNKRYIKVVPNNGNSAEVFIHIMTAVLMLLKQEHYENFNGKNFTIPTFKPDVIRKPKNGVGSVKSYCVKKTHETNDINDNTIIIKSSENPVSVRDLVCNDNFTVKVEIDNKTYEITNDTFDEWVSTLKGDYKIIIEKINDKIDDDLLLETSLYSGRFFDIQDELYGLITRYATSKLSDVLKEINGENYFNDKEGYFKLFREDGITGSEIWSKKYKRLKERDGVNYHSTPWISLFNQTVKQFFDECYPDRQEFFADKEGYFKLFREEGITNSIVWSKNYKKLSERDGVNYHSAPWTIFEQPVKQFFDECFSKNTLNKEGYFKLFREEGITSSNVWHKKYKRLSERDGVNYHSNPWESLFNQTEKQFFAECYPERQEFFLNKEGYFKLFREEGITSGGVWSKKYKKLSERDGVNYPSEPWTIFEQTQKQFFDECFSKNTLNKEGYFKLFREEGITSGGVWSKKYKKLSERDGVNYPSEPWKSLLNQTVKQFFVEYREWLENNPKREREYHPAYLGEFSEMNKTWNTSNSKTTHVRLKDDKSEWINYHKLYSDARKNWSEIPYKVIADIIKSRPEWLVGDFGCGENLLSKEIPNKVLSFDHVAIDDTVISCDISNIPIENNIFDVVVFSLSLMGTNYKEYFKEAYRTLKPMGMVIIAEPSNRWKDRDEELKSLLIEEGFNISGDIKHTDKFIYVTAIKL